MSRAAGDLRPRLQNTTAFPDTEVELDVFDVGGELDEALQQIPPVRELAVPETERASGQSSSLPQPDVSLGRLDEGEQALEERELVVPGQGERTAPAGS